MGLFCGGQSFKVDVYHGTSLVLHCGFSLRRARGLAKHRDLDDCCHFLLKVEIVSIDWLKYPKIPSFCVMLYWEISFTRCLDLLSKIKKKKFLLPLSSFSSLKFTADREHW